MPCTPGPGCIAGDPLIYTVFSASLTSPAAMGGLWTLTILTNYGVPLPGATEVIPAYPFEGVFPSFGISDFLIMWNGGFYGVVLHAHDGYAAGSLYQASGFQTSADVMVAGGVPLINLPRPTLPVEIKAGGSLAGAGTVTAVSNGGDGMTSAEFKITDTFTADPNFLMNGTFTVFDSSYVCANGYLTGTGGPFTGGTGGSGGTPEPASWLTLLAGLVVLGVGQTRRRRA